jgi:chaperonin GroEL (HSP60 family)
MDELKDLKNFGPYMIHILGQIGINTVQDLMNSDYLSIRDRLINAGIQPNLNIFYSIEMGLQDRIWSDITEKEKMEIRSILEKGTGNKYEDR